MFGDAMLAADAEHRLRELRYRVRFGDPEEAWIAEEQLGRGPAIDLSGLRHAVPTIVLAVANLF